LFIIYYSCSRGSKRDWLNSRHSKVFYFMMLSNSQVLLYWWKKNETLVCRICKMTWENQSTHIKTVPLPLHARTHAHTHTHARARAHTQRPGIKPSLPWWQACDCLNFHICCMPKSLCEHTQ
jgi:hypothetical protein